jgi:hypothetical protein
VGKEASEERIRKVARQMFTDKTRRKEFERVRKKLRERY